MSEFYRKLLEAVIARQMELVVAPKVHLYEVWPECHNHFSVEIFIQLGGRTDFKLGRVPLSLKAGQILVMPPGVPHGEKFYDTDTPFYNMVVEHANPSIHIAELGQSSNQVKLSHRLKMVPEYREVLDALSKVIVMAEESPHLQPTVQQLIASYLTTLMDIPTFEHHEAEGQKHSSNMKQCLDLIEQNYNKPNFCVQWLAKEMGYTPNHLSSKFSKEMGETLHQHIIKRRIDESVELLISERCTVTQASQACGFRDASSYIQTFKNFHLQTPKQFIQKVLQEGEKRNRN